MFSFTYHKWTDFRGKKDNGILKIQTILQINDFLKGYIIKRIWNYTSKKRVKFIIINLIILGVVLNITFKIEEFN